VQKGEALPACPFGTRSCGALHAPVRGSIDAKIILWLKYFSRWDGVTLQNAPSQ
jgi:hypothetical protein